MNKFASHYLSCFQKAADPGAYGNPGLNVQSYAPVAGRRALSPDEQRRVHQGQDQFLPHIFASNADDISSQMNNGVLPTAGLATVGGVAGGMLGSAAGPVGALAGAGIGAVGGGVLGYLGNRRHNENLEDAMRRLPEGATTIRDMKSDPVYQADEGRAAQMRQMQMLMLLARR